MNLRAMEQFLYRIQIQLEKIPTGRMVQFLFSYFYCKVNGIPHTCISGWSAISVKMKLKAVAVVSEPWKIENILKLVGYPRGFARDASMIESIIIPTGVDNII